MTKNIKLPYCSLSIRETKNFGLHIAIFHHGKIFRRITKEDLFIIGRPLIYQQMIANPILIPIPLAEAILNLIDGSLNLNDFHYIIKTVQQAR